MTHVFIIPFITKLELFAKVLLTDQLINAMQNQRHAIISYMQDMIENNILSKAPVLFSFKGMHESIRVIIYIVHFYE